MKVWTRCASSGSWALKMRRQWKLPSPTCPTMGPVGPWVRLGLMEMAVASQLTPCPVVAVAPLTGEAGVLQVLLGLHHHVGQAGDGHADVRGVALGRAGQSCGTCSSMGCCHRCPCACPSPGSRAAGPGRRTRRCGAWPRAAPAPPAPLPRPGLSRRSAARSPLVTGREPWDGAATGPAAPAGTQPLARDPQSPSWAPIAHPETPLASLSLVPGHPSITQGCPLSLGTGFLPCIPQQTPRPLVHPSPW